MIWLPRGIPSVLHLRGEPFDSKQYVCGEPFFSWSERWLSAKSDLFEQDGELFYRFTSGEDVVLLSRCPECYTVEHFIPAVRQVRSQPVFESEADSDESEDVWEEPAEAVNEGEPIYLWDYVSLNL